MEATIWKTGDPEPEGVDVVYTQRYEGGPFDEWRRDGIVWYYHSAVSAPFILWSILLSAFGRLFSRPLRPGECIRGQA